jgi:hypothetical protein
MNLNVYMLKIVIIAITTPAQNITFPERFGILLRPKYIRAAQIIRVNTIPSPFIVASNSTITHAINSIQLIKSFFFLTGICIHSLSVFLKRRKRRSILRLSLFFTIVMITCIQVVSRSSNKLQYIV